MSAPPPYYPPGPGHQGGYQVPQAYQQGPYPITTPPQSGYAPSKLKLYTVSVEGLLNVSSKILLD